MTTRIPWPDLGRNLVAILRGITPDDAPGHVAALIELGFEAVEVPLNSPEPFTTIADLVRRFGTDSLIGAGTVLDPADCNRLADLGARFVVTPNTDPEVIRASVGGGMITMPGVLTPSEALLAWRSGASALKVFPASVPGPDGIAAMCAVLPPDVPVGVVGGVSDITLPQYYAGNARIFGMSTSLYRPGDDVATLRNKATRILAAYEACRGGGGPGT
ncbi:2-dehydro-3-deoxy-6-phosphogalactonate aldolase [Salipiger sp.]|uniref:2-dehydro-3-deoxy-6-phosphogalactonate aldolase n=1 Tax=Salipiger sp. TaxID=2078585 RepID=UPI003A980418